MTREITIDCVNRAKTNWFVPNLHEVSSHIRVLVMYRRGSALRLTGGYAYVRH